MIWHEAPFAVSANLAQVVEACKAGQFDRLERLSPKFQQALDGPSSIPVPTVAAVQGMALGGGCEFVMHATHRVLALESYRGLVEAGVGLIPAGRRLQRVRAAGGRPRQPGGGGDVFPSSRTCSRPSPWPTFQERPAGRRTGLCQARRPSCSMPVSLLHVAALARARRWPNPATSRRWSSREGGWPQRHRHLRDDAHQHEGGRLHLLPWDYCVAQSGRHRPVRRRGGKPTQGVEQWIPSWSALFVDLLKTEKDPAAHRAHAGNRQAAAQLIVMR